MNRACSNIVAGGGAALGVADWLHLAATPAFAAMALLNFSTTFAGVPAGANMPCHRLTSTLG